MAPIVTPVNKCFLREWNNATSQDPTVGPCLGSQRGPRGMGVFLCAKNPCRLQSVSVNPTNNEGLRATRFEYRSTSLITSRPPLQDHHSALGIAHLKGPMGAQFLVSEVAFREEGRGGVALEKVHGHSRCTSLFQTQSSKFLPWEPFSPEAGPSRTRSSKTWIPSHLHCTAGSSRSFTAIRKDAGLCCGSRLRKGEVLPMLGAFKT